MEFKQLFFELTATYVNATYATANNSGTHINPVTGEKDARCGQIDSRIIFNATAKYNLTKDANIFVNAYNLFDEEYMASRHPYGPRPGQPFTIMTGIEINL